MHKNSVHAQDFCPWNFMNLTDLSVELHRFSYEFHENMFRAKSGPNRSSRPLNTQILLEISIRIQWKTSRAQKNKSKNIEKSPIWGPMLGLFHTWRPGSKDMCF